VFVDGFFGIAAGVKREGFQTRKAVRVLQRVVMWIVILTVILMVEKGFAGTSWLSETIIVPFIVLQLISALKNASMAGLIKATELNKILDRIDNHKGMRKEI
jgi:phage-related holin